MKNLKRRLPALLLALLIAVFPLVMAVPVDAADESNPLLGSYDLPGIFDSSESSFVRLYTYDGIHSVVVPLVDKSLLPADRDPVAVVYFLTDYFSSPDPMYVYYPKAVYFYGDRPVIEKGFDGVPAPYFDVSFDEAYVFRMEGVRYRLDDGTPVVDYLRWIPDSYYGSTISTSVPAYIDGDFTISPSFDTKWFYLIEHTHNLSDYTFDLVTFPDVVSGVNSWVSDAVCDAASVFWSDGALTVLGILALASLAISFVILIIYLLAGWLKFK